MKKFGKQAMSLMLMGSMWLGVTTIETYANIKATPTASQVFIDGAEVAFDAYMIAENNYFKLRDIAEVMKGTEREFQITWDDTNKAINLVSHAIYASVGTELALGDGIEKNATENTASLYQDGIEVDLEAYVIDGNTYFKLRDLCSIIDVEVGWDGEKNQIILTTSTKATPTQEATPSTSTTTPSTTQTPTTQSAPTITHTSGKAIVGNVFYGAYSASSQSTKYHVSSSCYHAKKILDENLIYFDDIGVAMQNGYTACGTCGK